MRHIVFLLIGLMGSQLLAQSSRNQALSLARRAVKVMQKGYYEDSQEMLERALELDPGNIHIQYQLALVHYYQGDFAGTVEILKETIRDPEAPVEHFAFLGNAHDNLGDPESALKVYRRGLRKFPQSGRLYNEMGILSLNAGQFNEALSFWEQGIDQAPAYAPNYYWAAKALKNTQERLWTLLYAELFLLLEPDGERAFEMSELLLQTYPQCVEVVGDEMVIFHFSARAYERMADQGWVLRREEGNNSFEQMFVERFQAGGESWLKGLQGAPAIGQARKDFLLAWLGDKIALDRFQNALFLYWEAIYLAGHWEAYHQWLMQAGDEAAFGRWVTAGRNDLALSQWLEWQKVHPFSLKQEDRMNRLYWAAH